MNNNVIRDFQAGNFAIYCGAGISLNSGLPIVQHLLTCLFKKLKLDELDCQKLIQSDIPFERIIEILLIESEIDEIQNIFIKGILNNNHIFISKLAKNGLVKVIYTTNFDILIEKAMLAEGLKENIDFKVYKTEEELSRIDWNNKLIKLIKIHGCASEKKEMQITLSQLANNQILNLRKDLLDQIFSAKVCKSVFILGYSCSDFDLVPLIRDTEKKLSNIIFVEHSSKEKKYEPINLKIDKNPFKQYNGTRIIDNTERIVNQLWGSLKFGDSIEPCIIQDTNWTENIDNWYNENIIYSGEGFGHHIAAKLLYSIGDFKGTIKHANYSVEIALKSKNYIAYSSELGTLGMAYNKLGKFKNAIECFENSIPIHRQLSNYYNLSSVLQSYANTLHYVKRDKEAIIHFKEALNLARQIKDQNLECNILGNITNSYIAIGEILNARHYLSKSLQLSQFTGNKQAESSQLGLLAYICLSSGQPDQALKHLKTAIEIKKFIADYDELCKLYLNLMSIYEILGDKVNAKSTANAGIELAVKIGNKQRENEIRTALAIYNL